MSVSTSPSASSGPCCEPYDRTLEDAFRRAFRPEPALTVSEWADRHRVLSQKGASEPGPWRTDRTPYLREIMDCLSALSPVQRVVFMKGAQIGGTECGNNWIGYAIHHAPGPMMAVQPTTETAKRNSKQRIAPLIEESPALRERVKDARSRDSGNTVLVKEFSGGVLVMTGANSAVGLRSMPARYLFLDEVDAYPDDADGEGEPIDLAVTRSRNFQRRKAFLVSTPTIRGRSRIEAEYLATDRRRYFCPCPECGEFQTLEFAQLQWPPGRPDKARYVCVKCGVLLGDAHKTEMLARGEWRATAAGPAKVAGFHLSSLYSPVGWMSWIEVAQAWEKAHGNPKALKAFINTVLGETWVERGEAPDWEKLLLCREERPPRVVPDGGLFVTGAADVQGDRIEYGVFAWGLGMTAWLIDRGVLLGDTGQEETWVQLDQVVERRYVDEAGRPWPITAFGVDTGYNTPAAYAWIRRHAAAGVVYGLKGSKDKRAPPLGSPSKQDVDQGGRRVGTVLLWPIGGHGLKSATYAALRKTIEGTAEGELPPGALHLPNWADQDWLKQLTAEHLTVSANRDGYMVDRWEQLPGRPNEALDIAVYSRALAHHLADPLTAEDWQALVEEHAPPPADGDPQRKAAEKQPGAPDRAPSGGAGRLGNEAASAADDYWGGR